MADTFRLRRKQDGFVTDPITEAQAKTLAGYPSEFEKLPEVKPIVHKDDPAPKARASKPRSKPAAKKAAPAPTPAPAPAPAASDTTEG